MEENNNNQFAGNNEENLSEKSLDDIRKEQVDNEKIEEKTSEIKNTEEKPHLKLSVDLGSAMQPSQHAQEEKPKPEEKEKTQEQVQEESDKQKEQEEKPKPEEKVGLKLEGVYQPKGKMWGKVVKKEGESELRFQMRKILMFLADLFLDIVIILIIVVFIRVFLMSPFQVKGRSMYDTFENGDFIIVDEISYRFGDPQRGDIIVFKPPTKDSVSEQTGLACFFRKTYARITGENTETACIVSDYFVKRIIGTPGDTVKIKDGKVYVKPRNSDNEFKLVEAYLMPENQNHTCLTQSNSCATTLDMDGKTFEVPEDFYFVLGDNRNGSNDSRHWQENGQPSSYVPFDNIRGKVRVVIWPLNDIQWVGKENYESEQ